MVSKSDRFPIFSLAPACYATGGFGWNRVFRSSNPLPFLKVILEKKGYLRHFSRSTVFTICGCSYGVLTTNARKIGSVTKTKQKQKQKQNKPNKKIHVDGYFCRQLDPCLEIACDKATHYTATHPHQGFSLNF